MAAVHRNSIADGLTITGMSVYNEDSLGKRIAWARKHVEWTDSAGLRHIGMDQHQFAKRLITQGTPTGVRHVYVSQLENNHCTPAFPMFLKIAEVTGVTGGFLLRETDEPYPANGAHEPVYFSPEADKAAQLIDNVPPEERARILAVVQAMATAAAANTPPQRNEFAARLVTSDRVSLGRNVVRA